MQDKNFTDFTDFLLFPLFTVLGHDSVINALKRIDANKQGFVVVVDEEEKVLGVLTDGDIRRGFIAGRELTDIVEKFYTKNAKLVSIAEQTKQTEQSNHNSLSEVIDLFKNQAIKFLPIVDENNKLKNIITKTQLHTLLLQDIHADLSFNFSSLDTSIIDHEIYQRPWGYYKTTVLNEYFQAKIISVKPSGQLSLQSHKHREEYWIVVHGTGTVQLDESIRQVSCGITIFIPKGCKHRLINTDKKESLIITEVQIGDYFGEDDIIRYEDKYGRK